MLLETSSGFHYTSPADLLQIQESGYLVDCRPVIPAVRNFGAVEEKGFRNVISLTLWSYMYMFCNPLLNSKTNVIDILNISLL